MRGFLCLLFLGLPFVMAAQSEYEPCKACIYQATLAELSGVKLRLYTCDDLDTFTEVMVGNAADLLAKMDLNKSTVVFIFGWFGTTNWKNSQAVVTAYLERRDHNVLMLNWANIADKEYLYAARSIPGVGYTLATALNEWVTAGLNSSSIHLVGHSLGAHVCGYAGRYVNFTLPRIVGLEPAGPFFYTVLERLKPSDAEFVEVIHTDAGVLGMDLEVGHVDFYPNGGTSLQPGCLIAYTCSHVRSCLFYAESVRNEDAFIGRACDSNSKFKIGSCNFNGLSVMGYATPTTTRGKFYLQTNFASPYGLGVEGTTYDDSSNLLVSTIQSLMEVAASKDLIEAVSVPSTQRS
ncbi:pancreatic lipase-related protein 3-like isoform X1 [Neodiprion virginianus]|uniref:pancreatic lipase-related protein 3-like isoform X1 n=2 Tax=Neodiprion virginianus TaxID=2961670 RepID=UPI001EE6FC25|nr:pancreatic lipase-related protein 3-like isoform X1 [Neodiprion virginianus]XP_046617077.1 pancreatic lipase-related protein 3-like isoform X1 [Neodiprion virginianus]XP_046617078.1 pancreatic lipase-related protein 3-like isoform X1 [Neodiprion virginianus]